MADTRNCPKCDTLMDYRLGEYECPSCGHTEGSAQSVGGVQSGRGLSGPGFQQPPPPPPGGNVPGMPGSRMGYQGSPLEPGYGGGGAGAGFDSLESEKNLYIYIRVGLWALLLIAMIVISATGAGMMAGTGVGGMMWAAVLVILLYALVDIGLLFFILKSDQTWAKYCCMGCMGLRLIGIIFSFFAPDLAMQQQPAVMPMGVEVALNAVQILFDIWFFSILYRDTQQQY